MKFKEMESLTVEELRNRERELQEKLFEAGMKNSLGQLGSPIEIRKFRRDVARLKTALSQKLS